MSMEPQLLPAAKPNNKQNKYTTLDYSSLRELSSPQTPAVFTLLPGLGMGKRRSLAWAKPHPERQLIEQPNLLTTAKSKLREVQEETQPSQSHQLGLSSYLNSREVTPINPLAPSKRRNTSQKNKINSVTSELFDIQSNPEEEKVQLRHKHKDFRLLNVIRGQSQVVFRFVFGRERSINPKTVIAWKDCLTHEDKSQIYLPIDESKVQIPYTSTRIYQLNQIEKGLVEIYGVGKNRSLTIGEESIIIEGIERYLKLCSRDPLKIGRKDFDIIATILRECKMEELQVLPMCLKQVETHLKLMATKWRYSGSLNLSDRIVESALVMGKNNFLDLGRANVLTAFLLRNSTLQDP